MPQCEKKLCFFFSKISFVLLFTTWIFDIFVGREFLLESIAYKMVATSYARNTWALVGATISLLLIQTPRGNIVFVFRAGGGGVYSENGMQTTTSVRNLVEVLRCQTPYCLSHYEYFCLFFFSFLDLRIYAFLRQTYTYVHTRGNGVPLFFFSISQWMELWGLIPRRAKMKFSDSYYSFFFLYL